MIRPDCWRLLTVNVFPGRASAMLYHSLLHQRGPLLLTDWLSFPTDVLWRIKSNMEHSFLTLYLSTHMSSCMFQCHAESSAPRWCTFWVPKRIHAAHAGCIECSRRKPLRTGKPLGAEAKNRHLYNTAGNLQTSPSIF